MSEDAQLLPQLRDVVNNYLRIVVESGGFKGSSMRGLDPIGAKIRGVSRAQRNASLRRVVRCRPGIVTHTAFATVPDQRCTASLSLALHRIRDTSDLNLSAYGA